MKKCIKCGKPLPEEAVFCPCCETDQEDRRIMNAPVRKKWPLFTALIAILLVLFAAFLFFRHRPVTLEGGSSVVYHDGETEWTVLVTYDRNAVETHIGQDSIDLYLPRGMESLIYDLLFAFRKDDEPNKESAEASAEIFCEMIDSIEYDTGAFANENLIMTSGPSRDTSIFPQAAAFTALHYFSSSAVNDLTWTIHMKNGDTIILHHSMHVDMQETISVSESDYPLDNMQDLNDTLETLSEKYPHDLIEVTLPPVTYEGSLKIPNRGFSLIGTEEEGQMTTFSQTVEIFSRNAQITEITGVNFKGSGGVGVLAHEGVILTDCIFSGWDTAVNGQEGSWPMLTGDRFTDNQTAFLFNSTHATCSNTVYDGNEFENNETAVFLVNVPGQGELYFTNCSFEDNETDLINNSTYNILYEEP